MALHVVAASAALLAAAVVPGTSGPRENLFDDGWKFFRGDSVSVKSSN